VNIAELILLAGAVGAVLTAGAALARLRPERRQIAAATTQADTDAAATVTTSALALLEPLQHEVVALRASLTDTQADLAAAQTRIAELEATVATLHEGN
jgi:septal ring factor EnvC (AmiA/AmiB activator)